MWAKVDDRLHAHPKAAEAGLEAMGLHLLAMSFCAAYETDGHVKERFPTEKAGERAGVLVERLVQVGLWELNGNGWRIHDWLKYNLSKREAKQLAKARALAGKAGGKAAAKR